MKTSLTRICFAIAALLLGSFAAQAADLPQPSYKAPAYVGPSYANWSGFYIGINGGYGWGTSNWDFPAISTKPKGAVYGGTIGYNFQTGTWVWGIEGDFDGTSMKGSADCFGVGGGCETKLPWLATGRLRLGYAGWNNWLPYITGGAAYGNIKATSPFGDATKSKIGWTAGVGIEWAFLANWSAKVEYLYVDLGKFDCSITCGAIPDNVSFKSSLARIGVNYRF
jgi:outer membrane immunogenic protein